MTILRIPSRTAGYARRKDTTLAATEAAIEAKKATATAVRTMVIMVGLLVGGALSMDAL